jgi:hypothetical protein
VSRTRWPAYYEIRVEGILHEMWSDWFEGMRIEIVGDATVLSGTLPDQSALHGILDKVRDLGLTVINVRRVLPGEGRTEDRGRCDHSCTWVSTPAKNWTPLAD